MQVSAICQNFNWYLLRSNEVDLCYASHTAIVGRRRNNYILSSTELKALGELIV